MRRKPTSPLLKAGEWFETLAITPDIELKLQFDISSTGKISIKSMKKLIQLSLLPFFGFLNGCVTTGDLDQRVSQVSNVKQGVTVETDPVAAMAVRSAEDMVMYWCAPGTFTMGCPSSEDSGRIIENTPLHEVTITKGFYLGKYEVTQAQWIAVMGTNPSRVKGDNLPVANVHWFDAKEFCSKLTEMEQNASRLQNGWEYTLPTEAEWEYACRAGTMTVFSWGNDINSSMAQYSRKAHAKPVGSYPSNNWGFYDMHGNIYEWCSDWYGEYSASPRTDPVGPTSGDRRVQRGGGFFNPWFKLRSASRGSNAPTDRSTTGNTGFRVAYKRIGK